MSRIPGISWQRNPLTGVPSLFRIVPRHAMSGERHRVAALHETTLEVLRSLLHRDRSELRQHPCLGFLQRRVQPRVDRLLDQTERRIRLRTDVEQRRVAGRLVDIARMGTRAEVQGETVEDNVIFLERTG